jgi:prepilin signal peptidase PulO-like enzyme (type II secretory pathway)
LPQNLKNSSGKRDRGQALRKNSLSFEKYCVTMKSEIPFAPFLIAGMAVVFFCSVDIFTVIGWFEHAFI